MAQTFPQFFVEPLTLFNSESGTGVIKRESKIFSTVAHNVIFRQRLKTFLFRRFYLDLIIRHSGLTFYCRPSIVTVVFHWRSQDFVLRGPVNRDAEGVEMGNGGPEGVSPSRAD